MKLWHCRDARSFRALWALEELGLPYELVLLPFGPQVQAQARLINAMEGLCLRSTCSDDCVSLAFGLAALALVARRA